jgi:uncharacterized protein (TIGR03086 family)
MDLLTSLAAASADFHQRAVIVTDQQWSWPTPCDGWDVHYLMAHVVGGNRFATMVLGGRSAADAIDIVMSERQLGDVPLVDLRDTDSAQRVAFADHHASDVVDHPTGPITVERFLEMRVFDIALHAWDLAVAIGADRTIDPRLVDAVLDILGDDPQAMGFGITPLGRVGADATPQDRLLDLTGRAAD